MIKANPLLFTDVFYSSDELKSFFSKYGKVLEHQIIRDHETNRSRGFGFVIFDSEEVVDEMLSKGNMIDMAGTQVSLLGWSSRNQLLKGLLFVTKHVLFQSLFTLQIYLFGVVYSVDLYAYPISMVVFYFLFTTSNNYRWRLLQV